MDPRTLGNIRSLEALIELLRSLISQPHAFVDDQQLFAALRSQGGMAKYSDSSRKISPSSINTLKRIANEHFDGGWKRVDDLREQAFSTLEAIRKSAPRAERNTKAAKDATLTEVKSNLENLQRVNLVMLRVLTQTIDDLGLIGSAKSSGERTRLISESIQRARASLLSNRPPFDRLEPTRLVVVEKSL
jgi:hypothetical protein